MAVRGRAITDELGINLRATRFRMFEFLDHEHAGTGGTHEAVAIDVIRTRRNCRSVVVLRRQCSHGIEHARQVPVLFLATTGKHDVLLVELDQLSCIADAMRARGTGRRNRVIDAFDLERCRKARGHGAAHRARHNVRSDLAHAPIAECVRAANYVCAGGAAGRCDQSSTHARDIAVLKTGVIDRPLHRDIGVRRRITHESKCLAINVFLEIDIDAAGNVAA